MERVYWSQSRLNVYQSKVTSPETKHQLSLYRCFGSEAAFPSFKSPKDYFIHQQLISNPEIVETIENNESFGDANSDSIYLFVHGAGGCAEQFGSLMKILIRDPKNILYSFDMHGHRYSFDPENNEWEEYEAQKLRADLHFILDLITKEYEQIISPISKRNFKLKLICHSYGTGLTVSTIQNYFRQSEQNQLEVPKFISNLDRVTLISTCNSIPTATKSFLWYFPASFIEWIRPMLSKVNDRIMYHSSTSDNIIEYWRKIASTNSIAMMRSLLRQMEWPNETDIQYVKDKIPICKFIFISGEVDQLTPASQAESLSKACSGKFVLLKETSHNLIVEKPDEVISIIIED